MLQSYLLSSLRPFVLDDLDDLFDRALNLIVDDEIQTCELLAEFCAHALDQHYVAVAVDEADLCEPAALRYFRDLMSESARRDPRREVRTDVVVLPPGSLLRQEVGKAQRVWERLDDRDPLT